MTASRVLTFLIDIAETHEQINFPVEFAFFLNTLIEFFSRKRPFCSLVASYRANRLNTFVRNRITRASFNQICISNKRQSDNDVIIILIEYTNNIYRPAHDIG